MRVRYKPTHSHILQICIGGKWSYICAKPGSNQWGENEARVACYQMGMSCQEQSGIKICLMDWIIYLLYFGIVLSTTDQHHEVKLKNIICSRVEENVINCLVISAYELYNCLYEYKSGTHGYYYANVTAFQVYSQCVLINYSWSVL